MKPADFRKRLEASSKELDKLKRDLDELKKHRAEIAERITSAIDSNDFDLVEKLTADQTKMDNKIHAAELIIARKTETNGINRSELVAANAAEMQELQKKIDRAQNLADEAYREYLRKLLTVAELVKQAWDTRTEYISIIPGIEDPTSTNAQTNDFDGVSNRIRLERDSETDSILQEINPDALEILNDATRDRFNRWAGRDTTPRKPNVTISKYD